jgi:hypothetical protein
MGAELDVLLPDTLLVQFYFMPTLEKPVSGISVNCLCCGHCVVQNAAVSQVDRQSTKH